MRIKKGGVRRECTEREYNTKFKRLGYSIIPEEVKKPLKPKINVDEYHKGGGWYEYDGETYRKADLLEKLAE
jgi:hypothetical protein